VILFNGGGRDGGHFRAGRARREVRKLRERGWRISNNRQWSNQLAGVVDTPAMSQSLDRKLDPLGQWSTVNGRPRPSVHLSQVFFISEERKNKEGKKEEGERALLYKLRLQNRRRARDPSQSGTFRGKDGGGRGERANEGKEAEGSSESWRTGKRERCRDAS